MRLDLYSLSFQFPKDVVRFEGKTDTDLYDLLKVRFTARHIFPLPLPPAVGARAHMGTTCLPLAGARQAVAAPLLCRWQPLHTDRK